MYLIRKRTLFLLVVIIAIGTGSCNKWEDHIAADSPALNETLMEQIAKHSNLSRFNELLVSSGLDKEISASKNFTVWAPTNAALQTLATDIVNDKTKLRNFLLNHISGQQFFTRMATSAVRVPMMNGKRVSQLNKAFSDATIVEADISVKNGVLHVIDKMVPPLPSIWEFIVNSKATYLQNAYLSTLEYESQDPALAKIEGINPSTGEPIYVPGTGIIKINTFRAKVYDVANEDSLYTYLVLNNTAYTDAANAQKPYFKSASVDTTNANASWNVVKDLAIRGLYTADQLPQVLLSKSNVKINLTTAKITETQKVSNGIVYVINSAGFDMAEKIPSFLIEGENPFKFSSTSDNFATKIMYRERFNPVTGKNFKDIYLNLGSIGTNAFVQYVSNNVFTTKYKVYAVSLSDRVISGQGDDPYGTDSIMTQSVEIGDTTAAPFTAKAQFTMSLTPYNYQEVYLGEYTNDTYSWLLSYPESLPDGRNYKINKATKVIRLKAPSVLKTGIPNNLSLDYLKFVPVF